MGFARKTQRTKIVCTLGPATSAFEMIRALAVEGVDCFRINLSHGTREEHAEMVSKIRQASREAGRDVPILLDLRGAKIRTTESEPDPFELRSGSEVTLAGGSAPSTERRICVLPAGALKNLREGDRVLIDDGKIELAVLSKGPGEWKCRVDVGGPVKGRRGVTLPGVSTDHLPGLTEKDLSDIEFGVRQGVDFFALSFVRSAADVVAAKREIARLGAEIPIIAKLEKPEAVARLDAILEEAYGVMVARGDLGVEAPLEKVPVYQKQIIASARRARKPVITATQMLESMIERPVPTRAEVSDVANAVFDGTDAVMLSGETSMGKYPLEAVRRMALVAEEAERALFEAPCERTFSAERRTFPDALGAAASVAAESVEARCIVIFTASGYSAALVSGYRPCVPMYAFTPDESVAKRLAIRWGVEPRLIRPPPASVEEFVRRAETTLIEDGLLASGDAYAVVAGVPLEEKANTNLLQLRRAGA